MRTFSTWLKRGSAATRVPAMGPCDGALRWGPALRRFAPRAPHRTPRTDEVPRSLSEALLTTEPPTRLRSIRPAPTSPSRPNFQPGHGAHSVYRRVAASVRAAMTVSRASTAPRSGRRLSLTELLGAHLGHARIASRGSHRHATGTIRGRDQHEQHCGAGQTRGIAVPLQRLTHSWSLVKVPRNALSMPRPVDLVFTLRRRPRLSGGGRCPPSRSGGESRRRSRGTSTGRRAASSRPRAGSRCSASCRGR